MKALTMMATAAISAAFAASGFGGSAQRIVNDQGMPEKKRIPRAAFKRRTRNCMPHYGAKESAKRYEEVVNRWTGHKTIRRV